MNQTIGMLHLSFPFGGGETATLHLAEGLFRCGYHIYIFCTDYRKELENPAADFYTVKVMPDSAHINSEENIRYLQENIQELRISNFCITSSEFAHTIRRLKENGCLAKLVYIQHCQAFWEKQSDLDTSYMHGVQKLKMGFINFFKEELFKKYTNRWKQRYTLIYDYCDCYITLHPQYSLEIQTAIKRDGRKFASIPNMTVPGAYCKEKKKQLLYCGRMSRIDKRVDRLIKIWKRIYQEMPQWELVLVGDGNEGPALRALATRLHLPRVRFEGWQKEVTKYYREASIICLTSTFESFGLCLTEGMSYGCVPIAFNCSAGVKDIVQGNGILVPAFRMNEYADRLLALMKNDDMRTELQQCSYQSVQRFYPGHILPQWIKIFEE